jgi:hypothetical protein
LELDGFGVVEEAATSIIAGGSGPIYSVCEQDTTNLLDWDLLLAHSK